MKANHSFWEYKEWLKPVDLLIVGGGIVGASTALFYKKAHPDHNVLLVDKGWMPEGASTRNAGFACIGSISEHLADIEKTGENTVAERIERRWKGLNLLKEVMGEDALEYEQTGGIEIFTDDTEFERCREQTDRINQLVFNATGQENVYSSIRFEGYKAIKNRLEGAINSGRMMRELHQKVSRAGVKTLWGCRVLSASNGYVDLSNGQRLEAEKTILAVNGFISHLAALNVKPARGSVFITKPIPKLRWKGTFHYNEGYVYFRNIGDRLLLGGGRNMDPEGETTTSFEVNPHIKKYLMQFAGNVLKLPKGWSVDMEWSGIMGMTESKEPVIKQIDSHTWCAAGLSGMGIAIGMQVAKDVLGLMEGDT